MSVIDNGLVRRVLTSSLVDSLTAPHGVDRYLELVDPRWAVNEVRGRVERVWRQTPTCTTITLSLNGAWAGHTAGQFVRVGALVDGVLQTRCYSIETPPSTAGATTIEITVGEHPAARSRPISYVTCNQATCSDSPRPKVISPFRTSCPTSWCCSRPERASRR